jgi:hypothetical protein
MYPGFFNMPQICDMGTDNFTSLPKEGVLRIFYRPLKNPTASAGFEPANLGIRGQHMFLVKVNEFNKELTNPLKMI